MVWFRTERTLAALCLAACSEDPETRVTGLAAEVADAMPTVVTVTWQTDVAETGHVAFGTDGTRARNTPDEAAPGTDHRATLVGLPPDTTVSLQVVSAGGTSEPITVTTGVLSDPPPDLAREGEGAGAFLATVMLQDTRNDVVLVDPDGRIVWHRVDTLGPQVFRARASLDGTGMVYAVTLEDAEPSESSALVRVSWDGESVEVLPVPFLAHDFVELPDGTLVSLAFEFRDELQGNKLVSVARDGTTTDLWTTWDCFDPIVHPGDDPIRGWTHANALDYDPVRDVFLVGLRNFDAIVEVGRDGTCNWVFGKEAGTVDIDGPQFVHSHQFERIPDGLLVFDNSGAPGDLSRVLEYSFDADAGTASLAREIVADPPVYSFILGDVHRADDGDTVVTWGFTGFVDRIAADDTRVGRLEAPEGVGFGFVQVLEDPQRPE